MTAAQKTAKAKFKQAIAYRQKTGVSLKEAFAHVYGKKVGAAPKKKAAKKVAKKKVVKKAAPKKVAKKRIVKKVAKKKVYGTKKRKPIKEQSILNKIHKVKDQVNQLDELQHKHMMGSIEKYKNTLKEVKLYDAAIKKVNDNFKGLSAGEKSRVMRVKKKLIDAKNELKTHAAQLKKTF